MAKSCLFKFILIKTYFETSWAPVYELNRALSFDLSFDQGSKYA